MKKGFTLIEVLVMLSIMSLIVVVATNVFLATVKSNLKTKTVTDLKEKGTSALLLMEKMIRQSAAITSTCDGTRTSSITIEDFDGNATVFGCDGITETIASNSAVLVDDVDEVDCTNFITCNISNNKSRVVIEFSLTKGGSSLQPDSYTTVDFKTTVTARNN